MADVRALCRELGQVRNALDADTIQIGGIDVSVAATLSIGVTNANAINIGSAGITTTILGDLDVNGILTIIDGGSLICDGDVTLGGGDGDTITLGGTFSTANDTVNIGTANVGGDTLVYLRVDMGVNQDKRINFDRAVDSEGAFILPDTKDAPVGLAQGMIRITAAGDLEWYNGAIWATASSTAYTLDQAYDAGGAGLGRAITADSGAVTITVPNASNNAALELTQNDIVNNPAGLTVTNAGTGSSINLAGTTRTIRSTAQDMTVGVTANDAAAYVLHITSVNAGVGGTAGIGMAADDDIAISADNGLLSLHGKGGAKGIEIEAIAGGGVIEIGCAVLPNGISIGTQGARTISIGNTIAVSAGITALSIGISINANDAAAHVLSLSAANAGAGTSSIDIDAKSAITIDAGTGYSIDSSGASNVSTTSANLTVSTITAGVLYLTSAGLLTLTDGFKAASTYGTDLVLSDVAAEWSTFETNFGEVSLLNAINQCASTAVTLDEAYNASGGASTITVDAGDVTWNSVGAFSFVIGLVGCTGVADGFQITNGADFLSILRSDANKLDWTSEFESFDLNSSRDVTIDSGTTVQIGTGAGGFTVNTTQLVVDQTTGYLGLGVAVPSGMISMDGEANRQMGVERRTAADTAGKNLAIAAGGATVGATNKNGGNLNLTSGISTGTGTSGFNLYAYPAGAPGIVDNAPIAMIQGAAALLVLGDTTGTTATTIQTGTGAMTFTAGGIWDVNATGAVTIDSNTTFSIDGTGASNVSATSGNLTISTITAGVLYLTSAGLLTLTDGFKAASTYGTDLVLSDAAAEWDTFEANFGEVSLLNAINQCASSAVTLDEAYNAGVATITVDTYDVTWNLTGAFSHVVDLSGATGVADGFQVNNGTDYLRVLRSAANEVTFGLAATTVTIGASALMDINADANLDIDVTGTFDMLSSSTFSIDGTGASNVTATSGNLSISTLVAGTLVLDSVALIDMNAGANLDIDVTGTFDMLSTAAFSIDGTGASNVSATSGDLTVSTITSGTLYLNSVAAWSATGLDTTSLAMTANAVGDKTLSISATNAGGGAAFLSLSDGYKAGSTFGTDLVLSDSSAEWSTFEARYGEVSILSALNAAAPSASGLTYAENLDIDIATSPETVDTFTTATLGGATSVSGRVAWEWFAVCMDDSSPHVSGGRIGLSWDGTLDYHLNVDRDWNDGAEVDFSVVLANPGTDLVTVTLQATVTVDNYCVKVWRIPYVTAAATV